MTFKKSTSSLLKTNNPADPPVPVVIRLHLTAPIDDISNLDVPPEEALIHEIGAVP